MVARMVRNIDLVEALLFYGHDSFTVSTGGDDNDDDDNGIRTTLMSGVENLIDECKRDGTAVVAIVDSTKVDPSRRIFDTTFPVGGGGGNMKGSSGSGLVWVHPETVQPPNPRDLWDAIHSIVVQPRGFGGSSGFGRKVADPPRCPLPQHCVVLCTTEDQCRAARYVGMRVLCLNDNALADAIIDDDDDDGGSWESIGMDDIATPGSFWLNPPHPRDDDGNKVDPISVMEMYERPKMKEQEQQLHPSRQNKNKTNMDINADDEASRMDEYLASILSDIDPL